MHVDTSSTSGCGFGASLCSKWTFSSDLDFFILDCTSSVATLTTASITDATRLVLVSQTSEFSLLVRWRSSRWRGITYGLTRRCPYEWMAFFRSPIEMLLTYLVFISTRFNTGRLLFSSFRYSLRESVNVDNMPSSCNAASKLFRSGIGFGELPDVEAWKTTQPPWKTTTLPENTSQKSHINLSHSEKVARFDCQKTNSHKTQSTRAHLTIIFFTLHCFRYWSRGVCFVGKFFVYKLKLTLWSNTWWYQNK